MKAIRFTGVALFSAFLAVAPVYAQHGQEHDRGNRDQGRPEQSQHGQIQQQQHPSAPEQHQPPRAQQGPQHIQQPPQRVEQPQSYRRPQAQPPQRVQREQQQRIQAQPHPQRFEPRRDEPRTAREIGPRQQLRPMGEQRREQQLQQRNHWASYRANHWDVEHRTWVQRGGYTGYRVPDYYFRTHYGRAHFFRVYSLPFLVVGGAPRFQYAGYWFTPVEPFPEYWASNWYESEDVFIDYVDGGYYLYNRRYPSRPGIAISIVF